MADESGAAAIMRVLARGRAILLPLGAALAAVAGCSQAKPAASGAAPQASAATVSVVRTRRGPISRTIELPAVVRPREQAVLYAKVAGYLKAIRVDRGDSVREGDLLAEIESPELVADLARQQAEVAVAQTAHRRVSEAQKKAPDLVMPQVADEAKGRLDMARASLQRTETLLAYTKIRAPLSGVVTRRSVDPGAFIPSATSGSVAGSAALLTIMDIRSVRVEMPVPEAEVPLVRIGLPVTVTVDELPGHVFEARVTRFAYALEESSKTMEAEAEIANPASQLRPGMYARARIGIERRPDALLIPAGALAPGKGQDYVFTVTDGKARRIAVKVGFRDGTSVEILDGLTADQVVVLVGASPPADGQAVTMAEGR
jgi:membrane fusion protein (multidrug efflux system)